MPAAGCPTATPATRDLSASPDLAALPPAAIRSAAIGPLPSSQRHRANAIGPPSQDWPQRLASTSRLDRPATMAMSPWLCRHGHVAIVLPQSTCRNKPVAINLPSWPGSPGAGRDRASRNPAATLSCYGRWPDGGGAGVACALRRCAQLNTPSSIDTRAKPTMPARARRDAEAGMGKPGRDSTLKQIGRTAAAIAPGRSSVCNPAPSRCSSRCGPAQLGRPHQRAWALQLCCAATQAWQITSRAPTLQLPRARKAWGRLTGRP